MKEWLRKNFPWLITALIAIGTLFFWIFQNNNPDWSSLLVNLASGFIVSAVTIGFIDSLIKKQHERETFPLQQALLRDVDQFKCDLVDLWKVMYIQSIDNRRPITIGELFTKEVIESIFQNLDLEGNPDLFPFTNWYPFIKDYHDSMFTLGNRILGIYVSVAPPEILETVHYLIYSSVLTGHFIDYAIQRREYEEKNRIPHRPMLKTHTILPKDHDYQKVQNLLSWCKDYRRELYGKTKYEHKETIIFDPEIPPTSILTEEQKEQIEAEWNAWRERT